MEVGILEKKIKIGIIGYGNLGKGVELAISRNKDMELVAIFTRRPVNLIKCYDKNVKILSVDLAKDYIEKIDVMILCGGSSTDIPIQGPHFASMFNTVDGYDNHGKIAEYLEVMNNVALDNKNTCVICAGWDPGLFSLNRVLLESILPSGITYTFWGPGVSQGHSDAVRRIPGVKKAIQYTLPNMDNINKIRSGEILSLSNKERHRRKCYVVAEEHANKNEIEDCIKLMPDYFRDYDTEVVFITEEEFIKEHSKMSHGGFVIRSGQTGKNLNNRHLAEFTLKLDSNSEFTAAVLVTYARAVHKLNKEGCIGAKTVLDIPLRYLSTKSIEDLCKTSI